MRIIWNCILIFFGILLNLKAKNIIQKKNNNSIKIYLEYHLNKQFKIELNIKFLKLN